MLSVDAPTDASTSSTAGPSAAIGSDSSGASLSEEDRLRDSGSVMATVSSSVAGTELVRTEEWGVLDIDTSSRARWASMAISVNVGSRRTRYFFFGQLANTNSSYPTSSSDGMPALFAQKFPCSLRLHFLS